MKNQRRKELRLATAAEFLSRKSFASMDPAAMRSLTNTFSGESRSMSELVAHVRSLQERRVPSAQHFGRVLLAWLTIMEDSYVLLNRMQTDEGLALLVLHGLPMFLQLGAVASRVAAATLSPDRPGHGPKAWYLPHEDVTTMYTPSLCPRFKIFARAVRDISSPPGPMGQIDRLLLHGSLDITEAALAKKTDAELRAHKPTESHAAPVIELPRSRATVRTYQPEPPNPSDPGSSQGSSQDPLPKRPRRE